MIPLTKKLLIASPVAPIVDTSPVGGQTFLSIFRAYDNTHTYTYTYVVPENVTYISAVAIGGGGRGGDVATSTSKAAGGGGGGALAYSNKIPVTPGESLTINVGNLQNRPASSSIMRGNTTLLLAAGGLDGNNNTGTNASLGGSGGLASTSIGQFCFSGGNGANGATSTVAGNTSPQRRGAGAGGAAGYAGVGGNGATYYNGESSPTNAGGGGGGAAGGGGSTSSNLFNGGDGGGVGLYGLGSSGSGGLLGSSSNGNLDGDTGSSLDGDTFNFFRTGTGDQLDYSTGFGGGGGGARYSSSSTAQYGRPGKSGAVRIIHGTNETYPINSTTNNISFVRSVTSSGSTINLPADIQIGDFFILQDLADYTTNTYTGSIPSFQAPVGWEFLKDSSNTTTFTKYYCAYLLATSENITSLPNLVVTGHGGTTSYNSKVLLQFRAEKTVAIYRNVEQNAANIDLSTQPATVSINQATFPYSRGMSIVLAFFRGSSTITAGTNVNHIGANYVEGAAGTNTIVSFKIFDQSQTTLQNSITMADVGTNTRIVNHLLCY